MTLNTRVIRILLRANTLPFVEIQEGLRIQVLPNITYLPNCQKHQFAAFIADSGMLLVWDDEPKKILARAEKLETAILKMIWGNESAYPEEAPPEKKEAYVETDEVNGDLEAAAAKPRKMVLIQPVLTAFTLCFAITALGAGYRNIALEIATDNNYMRVLFILSFLPQFWLSLVRIMLARVYAHRSHFPSSSSNLLQPAFFSSLDQSAKCTKTLNHIQELHLAD
jgi:hypothetical protein